MMLTAVRKLCGHVSTGPYGVTDQSKDRINSPICLLRRSKTPSVDRLPTRNRLGLLLPKLTISSNTIFRVPSFAPQIVSAL